MPLVESAFLRTIAAAPGDDAPRLDVGDFAPALAKSPWLSRVAHLDLCGNRLGDDGVVALARSDAVRDLHGIDLSFNSLSNDGLQGLLDAGAWPQLTSLDLRGN